MNPANLTAAERDTKLMLAGLNLLRDTLSRNEARPVDMIGQIDRLCERLSAPVAAYGTSKKEHKRFRFSHRRVERLKKRIASDYRKISFDKHEMLALCWALERITPSPQATEPVNAELLTALSGLSAAIRRTDDQRLFDRLSLELMESAEAIARAESALAAQKGGK